MVSPDVIATVLQTAISLATHSWENGTVAEAILEWDTPSASIWNAPFDESGNIPTLDVSNTPALSYIKPWILTNSVTLMDGEGASGDPASVGTFAIMIGQSEKTYLDAAGRQVDHLLHDVPRWDNDPNGAISHREDKAVLWADFTYMVPPTLAYYAIATSDLELAKQAADQVVKYSEVLAPNGGLWQHIVGPEAQDLGKWSTGNAWAAAGAARVLATLRKSKFDADTKAQQDQLIAIIKGILDGAMALPDGLLPNYLSTENANCPDECFDEISGTALLAATAFRMAKLGPETFGEAYKTWATGKREAIDSHIDTTSGVVAPAVNPLNWHDSTPFTTGSPEGQAFVVLLAAAERDLSS
ncbi:Six-hairpin glycosidase-like protein [Lophiotrema nucula]|uniref:Six-hairpin glycosidase-like protein n=1 Tax=Lophiotrema nucula TaxID=690887 RepID=A0A6A5ZF91_9PLEO|nr:Six-hairpin glycosidase-like protein [Lophiotrema nucula]